MSKSPPRNIMPRASLLDNTPILTHAPGKCSFPAFLSFSSSHTTPSSPLVFSLTWSAHACRDTCQAKISKGRRDDYISRRQTNNHDRANNTTERTPPSSGQR